MYFPNELWTFLKWNCVPGNQSTKEGILPVQFHPFPVYPVSQEHVKDPIVFVQMPPTAEQLWLPVSHSLTSETIRYQNIRILEIALTKRLPAGNVSHVF